MLVNKLEFWLELRLFSLNLRQRALTINHHGCKRLNLFPQICSVLLLTPLQHSHDACLFTCRILKLSELNPLSFKSDFFELIHLAYTPGRDLLIALSHIERKTQPYLSRMCVIGQHQLIELHLLNCFHTQVRRRLLAAYERVQQTDWLFVAFLLLTDVAG